HRTPRQGVENQDEYRFAWWRGWHDPAAPAHHEDRRSTPAYAWRTSDVIYADERDYSALVLCPIRQSVSAHYARRYACPVSTEKARRLRYQTGRANQASAQSTPQRCDQSAGGALCCLSP